MADYLFAIPAARDALAHAADVTLTEPDLAAIREILPTGGFGARYAEEHIPNRV
ncbi:hypothetical protein GCM10010496_33390 [Streptomyces asoensis]|nr:hypothetical protein GCM10010496_33390 [Streptomyces asoensis]